MLADRRYSGLRMADSWKQMYRKSRVPSRAMTPAGGATLASPLGVIVAGCGGVSTSFACERVRSEASRRDGHERGGAKPPGAFCQLSTRLSRRRAAGSLGRAVPTGPGCGRAPRKPKIEARSRSGTTPCAPATRRRLERQIWPRPMKRRWSPVQESRIGASDPRARSCTSCRRWSGRRGRRCSHP